MMAVVFDQFILDSERKVHKSNLSKVAISEDKTGMYLILEIDRKEIVIDKYDLMDLLEEWQG